MLFDQEQTEKNALDALKSRPFSRYRLVADIVAFIVASYAVGFVGYVVDNTSHTPSPFPHISVFFLAFVFGLASYWISRKFGNSHFLGLKTILVTTFMGSFTAVILALLISAIIHGPTVFQNSGLGLFGAIFCAVIVFPVAMAVRLIATPIVNIFAPQDKPFNIPRS